MNAILTIDQIMNADDLRSKVLDVPEWGGSIKISQITKAKQNEIRLSATIDGEIDDLLLECGIVAAAIVEPELSLDHVAMLQQKNADVVDTIMHEVFLLNAMDKEAIARARDEFQDESGEVDGVLPGGETGDDGAAVAPVDVVD
jgi:hypothetical protein